jgi:biopolymer transport protein ExbB/TolQ
MKNKNASKAVVLAALAAIVFYVFVNLPVMRHSALHTYTTEHPTEYAIVILFFWANSELLLNFLSNRRERVSARYKWLPSRQGIEPLENAKALISHMKAGPHELNPTKMYRRIMVALDYVHDRQSASGFREYLQDLAVRDSDETFARYAFPRFTAGILPILGLLGTVVHFGSALSGLSSDQLTSRVPQIISGMGTAFNTTCAALTASLTTMLFRFLVERQEEYVVVAVNEYVENELLNRFVSHESEIQPVVDALTQTNHTLQTIEQAAHQLQQLGKEWTQDRAMLQNVQELLASERQLLVLQDRLAENLTVLNHSQHINEAVHGLTAAMHLLMSRQNDLHKSSRAA